MLRGEGRLARRSKALCGNTKGGMVVEAAPPGTGPLPAPPSQRHQPISVKALALNVPTEAWQTITWREGTVDWLSSRFARQRVRPAHRDTGLSEPRCRRVAADRVAARRSRAYQILACHTPGEISFEGLVDVAKLRWRIERDYQELKQELGLGDYEGRGCFHQDRLMHRPVRVSGDHPNYIDATSRPSGLNGTFPTRSS